MNDASNTSPTSEEGPRQIYLPRRELVCKFAGAGPTAGGTVRCRVDIPDSRLHWKISAIGVPVGTAPPATLLAGRGVLLWVAALEDDNVRGRRGTAVTNIYGTSSVPLAFPAEAGLGGYSIENFTSAADGIQFEFTVPAQLAGGVQGSIYIQARFQPATWQIIPWQQWDEIRSACKITVQSAVLNA